MAIPRFSTVLLLAAVQGCTAARPARPARAEPVAVAAPFPLSYQDPASFAHTYTVREGGDSVGAMEFRVLASRDSVVNAITGFQHSGSQQILASYDPRTLRVREVRDSAADVRVHLNYVDGRLRGTILYRNRLGRFNAVRLDDPMDSMMVDRRSVLVLAPLLPMEPGRVFMLRIFDSSTFSTYSVRITIGQREPVAVPAGTFDAYRLDLTAATPRYVCPGTVFHFPTVLWVRADSSRHILRIERPRLRHVYELTRQH
jgi:hypothetical protein